jgi:hypothetical protein
MAKAPLTPDELRAARFADTMGDTPLAEWGLALLEGTAARGGQIWTALAMVFNAGNEPALTDEFICGAVAWMRALRPPMVLRPPPGRDRDLHTHRGYALQWLRTRRGAETVAWVLERERRDTEALDAQIAAEVEAALAPFVEDPAP